MKGGISIILAGLLLMLVALLVSACVGTSIAPQVIVPGGDPTSGRAALQAWGCGSCHTIAGVAGANGKVGPSLNGISDRSYIGGHLRNTPANMMLWIMHPQQVSPGTDMPDSGVPDAVARDMAAYLYSIR